MENEIINKVAESGLITIDLEDYYPQGERVVFDIKPLLFQELILKEKEFREDLKNQDWNLYKDKYVSIICSADAIVPTWSFMLLATYIQPVAKCLVFGDLEMLETTIYNQLLGKLNLDIYINERVIIKGCGNLPVPKSAFVELVRLLRPIAKSIMYGEACSTVPLYKK